MTGESSILHIANGSSAVALMKDAGLPGDFLSWDDCLHEGPVPGGLNLEQLSEVRAKYIASCGWCDFSQAFERFRKRDATLESAAVKGEVVLWFEHDLYDQLQLMQLLDWFAQNEVACRLSLVQTGRHLGELPASDFPELFESRKRVSQAQLGLGRQAWRAFRSEDPRPLERMARGNHPELPFLADAFQRHLEEFPSVQDGLSRTERQILQVVQKGPVDPLELFSGFQKMEEARFMGDWSFFLHVERLCGARHPLLEITTGGSFQRPPAVSDLKDMKRQSLRVTARGFSVLEGHSDHVFGNGCERWLGGVHLQSSPDSDASNGRNIWRWDRMARRLTHDSELSPD